MPYGELMSIRAEILSNELDSGDYIKVHIAWYDIFLKSIGVTDEELKTSLCPENEVLLNEIKGKCLTKSYQYVIGLVDMGGECLCQIYLTHTHVYLVQNEFIKENFTKIGFAFWDYHIGEADIAHRMLIRKAVDKMMLDVPGVMSIPMDATGARASGTSSGRTTRFMLSTMPTTNSSSSRTPLQKSFARSASSTTI